MLESLLVAILAGVLTCIAVGFAYAIYTKPKEEKITVWILKLFRLNLHLLPKDIRGSPLFYRLTHAIDGYIADRRGVSAVIGVIVLLASLMIGAIVFSQLGYQAKNIAQSNNDTAALNFITSAMSTGWSALNMFIIAAIVMAAGFILALLIAWSRSGTGGGGV